MSDDRYEQTTYHGKRMDRLTKAGVQEMERRLGYELTILQGSFNHGVGASAGTHDEGGPIDLSPWDWRNKLRVAKLVGFAGWHRSRLWGVWPEHMHIFPLDHKKMAPVAMRQNTSYRGGRDGLVSNNRDSEPWRPDPLVHITYPPKKSADMTPPPVRTRMTKLRHTLALAITDASTGAAHTSGTRKATFIAAEKTLRTLMRALPKK